MRKKKQEMDTAQRPRDIRRTGEARLLSALLVSFFFLPVAHAQSFLGPCADPTSPSCALLVGSSTRALGITTSTVYSTQPSLIFRTQGGSNQHIILMPNGKVGIATSTPTSTLTVAGDIFATGNVYGTSFIGGTSGSVSAANVSSGVFGSLQGNGNFAFPVSLGVNTSTTAGLPQALSIYGGGYFSGNVGIGTTGPQTRLTVTGASGASTGVGTEGIFHVTTGTGGLSDEKLQIGVVDGSYGWIQALKPSTGYRNLVLNPNDGNVGIGTVSPGTYRLNVSGTGYFDDQLSARGINLVSTSSITLSGGNISGVNKLTVTTIDPLYSIGGVKYSTYAPSVAGGVYEEYIGNGRLMLQAPNSKSEILDKSQTQNFENQNGLEFSASNFEFTEPSYEYVIDFSKVEEGSDLWVWRQVVEFSPETVSVLATPRDAPAQIYYVLGENSVTFRSDRAASFSFR